MYMSKEIKIALVAIAGIVVLFFGMNFLKGMSLFSNNNTYYIKFKDISGLSASNPIFADGYQVGVVKGIDYDYKNNGYILVKFNVDNDLRIPKGSSAEIEKDLMGNVKMNLLLANNPRERVEPGDTILGALKGGLMGKITTLVPTVEQMLPKLDSILASVNALLADPDIAQSLHNIKKTTDNLTASTQQLNTLMVGLNRSIPGIMMKANTVLDNTSLLTANLAAVDVQGTMAEVNQTLANVKAVTDKINNNNGTLGLLMNDPTLYNNLNTTVKSADTLLTNLKAHPKRYVHFSLFGKKDK
ncbi:MAG: MlaD family protein [Prevotella sp.]|nr:MlaD family protein [Prevotella sp.]MCI1281962.1 MlaD family protein [Prevotella sp.]